ncbi:pilus assembly protein TadG-related protein [Phenylobacterium montanum]|uniref:Putative Flp pilus-assembly TadG-like N-terminal domain-containing protein n=1 Tax=Phenylobacterium montanum TaxID=2823693 RepID=A0A975IVV2_9CAUL|nr:pilus assembly protein TadG-related protein [Caulobacter sp. S6]QUD89387.1 hypothetical protein KCG34_05770 [Caulobacter sp. S6]
MPVIAAGAALGLEVGSWYYDQLKLQQAADAGAYAAAMEDREGASSGVMSSAAQAAAASDGFTTVTDTFTMNTPPTSGPNQNANSAEVILKRQETRYFSAVFSSTPVYVTARAVATFTTAANACVLALDPSVSQAVYFSGSSTVSFSGCNVMANSISNSAIYSQGATTVTVPCLMSAGGVALNALVTQTSCKSAMTNLAPVADPFRSVPEPTVSGSCQPSSGKTLQPGRYCGGLALNGTVNLKPGVYIIDGGSLTANGSANITGSGVTFFLANNASLTFNGNASLNLSAPTSGTYSGMLFFGSRSNTSSSLIKLNGTAGSVMTGAIYFPSQPVSYLGDMAGANGCTQVVALTVAWSGNANLAANCTAYGMNNLQVGGVVKLAE